MNNEEREKLIKDIFRVLNLCSLNSKTEEFVQSLEDFYNAKGYLSERQLEALMGVYERTT